MTEKTFQKYKLVIDEWFINGFNGTKAYKRFYPKSQNKSAESNFRKILAITRVSKYVQQKHKQAKEVLNTSHESLLKEIKNWAYSDITKTLSLEPNQIKELPADIRRLISKFKHTKRNITDKEGNISETIETIELQFVSKEKAMEMIMKHTGFYEKDNYQKSTLAIPSREERDAYIKKIEEKMKNSLKN